MGTASSYTYTHAGIANQLLNCVALHPIVNIHYKVIIPFHFTMPVCLDSFESGWGGEYHVKHQQYVTGVMGLANVSKWSSCGPYHLV